MDHKYSRSRIHITNTTKQGMRVPDRLLTDAVKNTVAYTDYDYAQKNDSVGITLKKTKATTGEGVGKVQRKSRSKKIERAPKKKLVTKRDQPTEEPEKEPTEKETQTHEEPEDQEKTKSKNKEKLKEPLEEPEHLSS